jgi:hypothetical protein
MKFCIFFRDSELEQVSRKLGDEKPGRSNKKLNGEVKKMAKHNFFKRNNLSFNSIILDGTT